MKKQWSPQTRYFVLSIVLIGLAVLAWFMRAMLAPFVVAGLFAYLLNPAVAWFKGRVRWSHNVAVNVVYFVSLAVLLAIPATIVPVLLNESQTLLVDLEDFPTQLQTFMGTPINVLGYQLNFSRFLPNLNQDLFSWIAPLPGTALQVLEATSRNVLLIILVVVTVYYLLRDWERLREWLIRLWPTAYRKDARRLLLEIKSIWAAYLRGQLALMLVLSIIYSIAWFALGLPGALILGVLTGLFNIVPELGPFVAAILAVIVALVEGSYYIPLSNIWFAVLVIGVYLALNYVKTIWIQPRILGHNVRLHEGVVFVAIVVSIVAWGVLAVLVVVPVLASAIVVGRYLRYRILGEDPFPPDEPEDESGSIPAETEATPNKE